MDDDNIASDDPRVAKALSVGLFVCGVVVLALTFSGLVWLLA